MNATQVRLDYLKTLLRDEERCADRSQLYVDDLNASIKRCEQQLKSSGGVLIINGAS